MDKLYIVLPAYNEEENIQSVINQWYPILDGKDEESRIVIADSGSTDNTHNILVDLKKEYSKLEILENTDKQHGPKVIALYDYAIKNGADYIFQTDSDGQTDPEDFPKFWEKRNDNDGVFGYRENREDGKIRAFVEKVVCFLLKMYFRVDVPDANAPFRLLKAETVKKYLYKLPKDYNLPNIMITTYFAFYKEETEFVNVSFKSRQAGVNTVDIKKIFKTGWKALGDFRRFKKEMKKA